MWLRDSAEWRTVLLIVICYFFLGLMILNPFGIPLIMQILIIIPLITLHSSLQHECIHGHPFVSEKLNDAIAIIPVGLLVPYLRFKETHIKHHQNASISDPYEDPESGYQDLEIWKTRPEWIRTIFDFNNTLFGRMLIGPTLSVVGFSFYELKNGDQKAIFIWLTHFVMSALVVTFIYVVSDMPVWAYLVCSYFAYSLLMVRTFLEHQAHESMRARTVIVEDKGFFSLLFLNNNLHVVHHAYPTVAWYKLPGIFQKNRQRFLEMNRGYSFKNYAEIFKRFTFSQKEPVPYPFTPKRPKAKKAPSRIDTATKAAAKTVSITDNVN
ncbi:fatty acid desaturase [Kiloniella majae]|uniref:fatty acid desaturase n=1 Tax=Kiloniella majae TaxID=1938558 RepID=UPI000F76629F|nr:fatty acid desaturase [Kiloniella majae]